MASCDKETESPDLQRADAGGAIGSGAGARRDGGHHRQNSQLDRHLPLHAHLHAEKEVSSH